LTHTGKNPILSFGFLPAAQAKMETRAKKRAKAEAEAKAGAVEGEKNALEAELSDLKKKLLARNVEIIELRRKKRRAKHQMAAVLEGKRADKARAAAKQRSAEMALSITGQYLWRNPSPPPRQQVYRDGRWQDKYEVQKMRVREAIKHTGPFWGA